MCALKRKRPLGVHEVIFFVLDLEEDCDNGDNPRVHFQCEKN